MRYTLYTKTKFNRAFPNSAVTVAHPLPYKIEEIDEVGDSPNSSSEEQSLALNLTELLPSAEVSSERF